MQHFTCKCGERTAFGSMGPAPCESCEKCGTTITYPGFWHDPIPHSYIPRYDEHTGKLYEVCEVCWEKKKENK